MKKGKVPGGRVINPITGIKITGSVSAFPDPILFPDGKVRDGVSNEEIFFMTLGKDYEKFFQDRNLSSEYPEKVIGLKHRRWTHIPGTPNNHAEENSVSLGIKAGQKLLAEKGLSPDDIDFLVFSSTTPHKITTASSCGVADGLGIKAPCIDIKAGCSSGLYSLITSSLYVKAGFSRVLLICSETPSKYANPQIQETVIGIGDGAVAILLEPSENENEGILGAFLGADGDLGKLVQTPGLLPPTRQALEEGLYFYHGDSTALKEAVPARYLDAMSSTFELTGLNADDIQLYVPHQVNRSLTLAVGKNLGFPEEKQFYNLHKHGSMAGAAMINALHEAMTEKRINSGDKVALNVVGGGLTWGAMIWQF